jgi:hypothetical protein
MKSLKALLVALAVLGMTGMAASPSFAVQLTPGCTCPSGFTPISASVCFRPVPATTIPATCTNAINQSIGHMASSQQQQSFWGIQMTLQQRRDQLQGTSRDQGPSSRITGFAPSDLDADSQTAALGYDGQSKKANPLASLAYKATPPPPPASTGWAVWGQGMGSWERDSPISPTDTGRTNSTYAAQGGIDRTWQGLASSDDALVLGIVSSWTTSQVSFNNSTTTSQMTGPGVGVYGTYVKGGFSTDLTTKFDFLQLNQDFAGAAPNTSIGITNAGVSGNMQYKITLAGNNFLEPTAGFSFTRTMFGDGATALNLQDTSTVRLQAGGRLGTSWTVNGVGIDTSLRALVYSNVLAQGSSSLTMNNSLNAAIAPTDQGLVRGEIDPQITFNLDHGYSVALSGSVYFGQALLGGSASLNLRKQW